MLQQKISLGTYIVDALACMDAEGVYAEITTDVEKQAPAKANPDDEDASGIVDGRSRYI